MDEESAKVVDAKFHQVCHEPCITHDIGPVFTKTDRPGLGERLILPLTANDDGKGSGGRFVLGCTIYDWLGFTEVPKDAEIAYRTTSIGLI